MSLLDRVVSQLEERGVPYCLIGGAALAAHGVSRSTLDLDVLATETRVLDPAMWEAMPRGEFEIRRGDAADPLAGVVRFTSSGQREVDLIVGRSAWQRRAIERARTAIIEGRELPVAGAVDLVLLKLFAGGPQDAWDTQHLLLEADSSLIEEVEAALEELPGDARDLWRRLRSGP